MSKQLQNAKTTMEPRSYQLELLEYVTRRNGIIYLPTGAGKTYVAILAIKRFSHDLDKAIGSGGKRIIFMTNTVELARQQAVEVRKSTNFKVGFYVGERDVDNWSRKKWKTEIAENQVLVGTAQIFLDVVMRKTLQISDLSLVIIDECHHATKQHPMHEFMRLFQYTDESQLPRVIGLTGVLLKGNKLNNIKKELETLEATYRGNIVTVGSLEQYNNVMVYSTKPKEELICFFSPDYVFNLSIDVAQHIADTIKMVDMFDLGNIPVQLTKGLHSIREPSKKNAIKNLLKDFLFQMEEYGFYAASIAIMSPIIEFEIKKRQAETLALRQLYRAVIVKCENIRHNIMKKLYEALDDDEKNVVTLDMILNYSTPKLRSLLTQMKNHFVGKTANDISCLIFVERRYTAKCLHYVVKKYVELTPELQDVVRPQFMVGRNSISANIASILDQKWNKNAIDSFREKECNVIICSNVLEEGIDVQACNYVFTLDPLKSFNSYIQTKGRARSANSRYSIFTLKSEELKTIEKVKNYRQIHEVIKNHLIGRILDRDDPKEEHIAEQFVDIIEPFMTKSGAMLLPSAALSLVNRYCQTLPSDLFGATQPRYMMAVHPTLKKEVVALELPLQSMVRQTIYSDLMHTIKDMRMSAAFNTCIKLYEKGELSDSLLPITKQDCLAKVSNDLFEHWLANDDNVLVRNAGKQYRRLYDRMCPEEFYNAIPNVGETCYAYELIFTAQFDADSYTAHIVDMLKVNSSYALLLRHPLPRLAEMPLFMNQGKLSVRVAERPIECCIITDVELQQLRHFHLMLFRDLLDIWKQFFVLDNRNKENSYLLVPLTEATVEQPQKHINWQLVRDFQRLLPSRTYSVRERQQRIYRPEDFIGRVVSKWYSVDDERYVVTAVRTDLSPRSKLEDNSCTYEEFTVSRYGSSIQRIVYPHQFLLEVRALTTRRNFFINAIGKTTTRQRKQNTIHLIPELCHNFMYPGDMWLKALFLPSVLHRLYYMLHANQLRLRINRYLQLPPDAEEQYHPCPIVVDTSLKRVIDNDGNAVQGEEIPKKVLPPLPPKERHSNFVVSSMMDDVESATWKPHVEPVDYVRRTDSMYSVELDYYYQFIMGLVSDLDRLKMYEDLELTKSQLNMEPIVVKHTAPLQQIDEFTRLTIGDVPLADKRRIEILERSFNTNGTIKMAEQYEFLAAITTSKSSDVFDMERLEILGDSFLKFAVTLYLANKYPNFHEGYLTEIKSRLVSNRNLLYCLLAHDIPKRICSILFNPKVEWVPPLASLPHNILALLEEQPKLMTNLSPRQLFSLELDEAQVVSGKCDDQQLEQFLSESTRKMEIKNGCIDLLDFDNEVYIFLNKVVIQDKVVADTLEALLGVCVKNYGIHRAFRMLEFFGVCRAKDGEKPLSHLLDLELGSALLRTNISIREVDGFLINREKLEENLGYTFKDRAYLLQALTHPSFPTNRLTGCYQELEFIGDAILDFLVSCYIFEQNESMNPGQLTDLRSSLVNNTTLGCVCVRHRFHLFLLAENSLLNESIKKFADFQQTQNFRVTDQVRILMEEDLIAANSIVQEDNQEGGCEQKKKINLAVNVDVPKALGDIVEALIAAVYLDSRDLVQTWHVVHKLLEPELSAFSMNVPLDPVRELCEHKLAKPNFSHAVVDDEVVMVKCTFACLDRSIEVNGFGKDSKQAKKSAAKHALKILAKYSN